MPVFTTRPVIRGSHAVLTSGHYLATAAGLRAIDRGGNAFDAAAAMAFCLCVLEPQNNGLGGEIVHQLVGLGQDIKTTVRMIDQLTTEGTAQAGLQRE